MSRGCKTEQILSDLEEAFFDVPFENSDFQNQAFLVAAQHTPGRAYRAIGLRMFAKLRAIDELRFSRMREDVDIEEKQAVIADPDASIYDKRRAQIDINERLSRRRWQDKLLNDAIRELDCLYAEFKKLPHYTREQFEAEERAHFERRLTQQLHHPSGAEESLLAMDRREHWDRLILESSSLRDQLQEPPSHAATDPAE